MHAGSTQHARRELSVLKKPLLRGGARPKYGDTIITALSRRPKQPRTHHALSPPCGRAAVRGCGCSLFPFPRSRFVLSSPSPDVRSVQRHHALHICICTPTPLSLPAGRRPAAVRAKATTTDTAPCLRPWTTRNVPRRRRAGPRLITA